MSEKGRFGSVDTQGYSSFQSGSATGHDVGGDFNRLSQTVSANVQKISQNVSQMQRMISQIGTQSDSPELRDKLHQLQHYTNQLAKETNRNLKSLNHLPPPSSPSDQRQQKIHKEKLMNDFSSALNSFQAAQRQQKEKEKDSVQRARAYSYTHQDPFADEQRHSGSGHSAQQQQIVQMEEDVDMDLLREREQAIHKLESDIVDVNQIFKDLGVMVHEQGEVIDSIEANVESAATHVSEGTEQLSRARNYQSKARKKKLCIALIILVVLIILAVIIGVSVSH